MYNQDFYYGRLEELQAEEANWERYLSEKAGALSEGELESVKSRLIGIRSEMQEISELVTGGFY